MESKNTDFITYEKLSSEIKNEITKYYKLKKAESDLTEEDAMHEWFDVNFDDWLMSRNGKDLENKRKHYRVEIEIPIKVYETLIECTDDETSCRSLRDSADRALCTCIGAQAGHRSSARCTRRACLSTRNLSAAHPWQAPRSASSSRPLSGQAEQSAVPAFPWLPRRATRAASVGRESAARQRR